MTWFKKKLKSLVTICLAAFLIVSVLPQTSVRAAETGGTSEMALGSDISAAAILTGNTQIKMEYQRNFMIFAKMIMV